MWVMKWRQANTVNSKMVINILLNDKMYFQWTVKSVYFNEDDRNLPTKTCSTKMAGWGFWRNIISGVALRVENQLSENAQFGNSRAECPGLLLEWIYSGEATEPPFRDVHVSVFSLHPPSLLLTFPLTSSPTSRTNSLLRPLRTLNKPNIPQPGILPHCCLKILANIWWGTDI